MWKIAFCFYIVSLSLIKYAQLRNIPEFVLDRGTNHFDRVKALLSAGGASSNIRIFSRCDLDNAVNLQQQSL